MLTLFIILLILLCVAMMLVVLLQSAKGGGLSGTFGGSNVSAMFGSRRTSDFLSKSTVVLATVFLISCLLINLYISYDTGVEESMIQRQSNQIQVPPPTAPPIDGQMPQTGEEQAPPTGNEQKSPQDNVNDNANDNKKPEGN